MATGGSSSTFIRSIEIGKKVGISVFTEKIAGVNIWSSGLSSSYLESYTTCRPQTTIQPDVFSWESGQVVSSQSAITVLTTSENPCDVSANTDDVLLPIAEDDFFTARRTCREMGGEIYFPTETEAEFPAFLSYVKEESQKSQCKDYVWTNVWRSEPGLAFIRNILNFIRSPEPDGTYNWTLTYPEDPPYVYPKFLKWGLNQPNAPQGSVSTLVGQIFI